MPLKAILIDDEANCRENLRILLEEYCPEVEIVATAENTSIADELISSLSPDVIFLDVMMPSEDGVTFLQRKNDRNFEVVFTTAHDEYALHAIKENAVHYLQKPIDIQELRSAVERLNQRKNKAGNPAMESFMANISSLKSSGRTSIPTKDGLALVKNEEIVRLEANESYTMIYLSTGKKYLSSKPIKAYEDHLGTDLFFRIHKSHIINVRDHLREFNRTAGNMAVMSNNDEVPVARRKLQSFLDRIVSF